MKRHKHLYYSPSSDNLADVPLVSLFPDAASASEKSRAKAKSKADARDKARAEKKRQRKENIRMGIPLVSPNKQKIHYRWIKFLVFLNICIFVAPFFVYRSLGTLRERFDYLSIVAYIKDTYSVFLSRDAYAEPWTLLTYAFLHAGWQHLLGNMLVLLSIGYLATHSKRRFISAYRFFLVYFLGVLISSVATIEYYHYYVDAPVGIQALGASAGVSAIVIFWCVYHPLSHIKIFRTHLNVYWTGDRNSPVYSVEERFFRVPAWFVGILFVSCDIAWATTGINHGGYIAHLSGAMVGFLLAISLTDFKMGKKIGHLWRPIGPTRKTGLRTFYFKLPKNVRSRFTQKYNLSHQDVRGSH